MSARRFLSRWGPVILQAAALFAASSLPSVPVAVTVWDKAAHFLAYAVFAMLWLRALHGTVAPPFRSGPVVVAVACAVLYGATDEIHQSFVPGRDASLLDLLADALGAIFGVAILVLTMSRRGRMRGEERPDAGV